jgi:cytochrome c6
VNKLIQGLLIALLMLLMGPAHCNGAGSTQGAELFQQHCAACHRNGGNIIRRGKTLKLKALERQGIASADAIAQIAREGVGQMSGYGDVLGPEGDRIVAEWIWEQAQNAWIQG